LLKFISFVDSTNPEMMSSTANSSTPAWLADEDKQPLRANAVNNDFNSQHGGALNVNTADVTRSGVGSPTGLGSSTPLPVSDHIIHLILRITSMGLCLLMAFTAVLGLGMISSIEASGRIFVGTYMLFFSAMLFFFELNQLRPIEFVEHLYRRNFGFLYGQLTKSLFVIL
jgi:hypothetical protein